MNPTNSELKACPVPYVVGKAIESIEAQVRNGATTVHLTNECAQAVLTALRTRKTEALADDAVSVSGLLDWIEQAWPEGSGSVFNQGVVRGFEIIRAQLQEGYIQRYCAALSALTPSLSVERDWWNPDPGDPYWLLEVREGFDGAGSWLKNKHSFLTTRDAHKALRFPSRWEAARVLGQLPMEQHGRFEPTEHVDVETPAAAALKEAKEMGRTTPEEQARAMGIGHKLDAEDGGYPAPDTTDLKARLRRKAQVLPPQGGGTISFGGEESHYITDDGRRLVNPDGPEAADALDAKDRTIERLEAEVERLRSDLRSCEAALGRRTEERNIFAEKLRKAADDLRAVGDDYPGSSCHKWCHERAAEALETLKSHP